MTYIWPFSARWINPDFSQTETIPEGDAPGHGIIIDAEGDTVCFCHEPHQLEFLRQALNTYGAEY